MAEDQARLQDTGLHDIDADARALRDLSIGWEPCYTFAVRYLREGPEWKATPSDGGQPITADSAAGLRAKLRLAAPVDRGAGHE